MHEDALIAALRRELQVNSDSKTRESGSRFFKEAVKLYGVKTAPVGKIGRDYFTKIKDYPKRAVFSRDMGTSGCVINRSKKTDTTSHLPSLFGIV